MAQEVEFHLGIGDKPGYACRLLRKVWARGGLRAVVTGSPGLLSRLDALLWTFEAGEFIPHARLPAGEAMAPVMARTPIWLSDLASAAGPADVLINLGPELPDAVTGFARLIDLVADEPDDLAAGRARWRLYKQQGLAPRDVRQSPAAD